MISRSDRNLPVTKSTNHRSKDDINSWCEGKIEILAAYTFLTSVWCFYMIPEKLDEGFISTMVL